MFFWGVVFFGVFKFFTIASHHPSPVNHRDIKRASTRCSRVMSEVGGCWLMAKLFPDTGDKINLFLLRWLSVDPFYTGIHHHVFQAQISKSNDTLQFSLARHAIASLFLCEDSRVMKICLGAATHRFVCSLGIPWNDNQKDPWWSRSFSPKQSCFRADEFFNSTRKKWVWKLRHLPDNYVLLDSPTSRDSPKKLDVIP